MTTRADQDSRFGFAVFHVAIGPTARQELVLVLKKAGLDVLLCCAAPIKALHIVVVGSFQEVAVARDFVGQFDADAPQRGLLVEKNARNTDPAQWAALLHLVHALMATRRFGIRPDFSDTDSAAGSVVTEAHGAERSTVVGKPCDCGASLLFPGGWCNICGDADVR